MALAIRATFTKLVAIVPFILHLHLLVLYNVSDQLTCSQWKLFKLAAHKTRSVLCILSDLMWLLD